MMISGFSTQWEVIHLRVYSWVFIYRLQWKLFCGSDGFCRCPFKIQVFFASFKSFSCMSADIQEKPVFCSRVVRGITWSHFDTSVWWYGVISIHRTNDKWKAHGPWDNIFSIYRGAKLMGHEITYFPYRGVKLMDHEITSLPYRGVLTWSHVITCFHI